MAAVSDANHISTYRDLRTGHEILCQMNGHKPCFIPLSVATAACRTQASAWASSAWWRGFAAWTTCEKPSPSPGRCTACTRKTVHSSQWSVVSGSFSESVARPASTVVSTSAIKPDTCPNNARNMFGRSVHHVKSALLCV